MISHISVFLIIHTPPAALMLFPSETASLSRPGTRKQFRSRKIFHKNISLPGSSSGWLAEDSRTAGADNHGLGVTKNCGDSEDNQNKFSC